MPLKSGRSKETIEANIQELIRSGRTPEEASAIAHEHARKSKDVGPMVPRTLAGFAPRMVRMDIGVTEVHVASTEGSTRDSPDAAIVFVYDELGRILTVSRPEPPHQQALPGGHVHVGEKPANAAVRECYEECGVALMGVWEITRLPMPGDRKGTLHVYSADGFVGVAYAGEPGTVVAWLEPQELLAQSSGEYRRVLDAINKQAGPMTRLRGREPGARTLKVLPTKKRNKLPESDFALPKQRKYPLPDANHVRNAAARLEQMHKAGKISEADYHEARGRIARAAKKFGIESQYNERAREETAKDAQPSLSVSIEHPEHGKFEIRHMKDGSSLFYGRVGLEANAGDGDGPVWVHIATRGHFEGHRAGSFDLDDQTFDEIIRNYREVDGGHVAFDFEHASEADGSQGSIPQGGAPAQGWIKDLKVGEKGLFALVQFLEPAKTQIREGRYKFVSPAIRFGARHPVTNAPIGTRLTSVALTNQPFLRGLEPIAAKDKPAAEADGSNSPGRNPNDNLLGRRMSNAKTQTYAYSAHEFMPRIKAALGMHELSTAAECGARLKALRALHDAGRGEMFEGVDVGSYVDRLRDMLDAPINVTVEELLEQVQEMIGAAIADHEAREHPNARDGLDTMTASVESTPGPNASPNPRYSPREEEEAAIAPGPGLDPKEEEEAAGAPGPTLDPKEEEEAAMSDKHAPAITMKELSVKMRSLETDNASLRLTLKERESTIAAKDDEIKAMKDAAGKLEVQLKERDEKDAVARVELAFDYYAGKHNLTEADKETMLIVCKADRAAFEKRYPTPTDPKGRRVPPYMLRNVAPTREGPPISSDGGTAPPNMPGGSISLTELTAKLMEEEKISMEQAQNKAITMRQNGAA